MRWCRKESMQSILGEQTRRVKYFVEEFSLETGLGHRSPRGESAYCALLASVTVVPLVASHQKLFHRSAAFPGTIPNAFGSSNSHFRSFSRFQLEILWTVLLCEARP